MKLSALNGDIGWDTYHAEWMRFLPETVWIDDQTLEFGLIRYMHGGFAWIDIHKAKKILILPKRKLVLINPIADDVMDGKVSQIDYTFDGSITTKSQP